MSQFSDDDDFGAMLAAFESEKSFLPKEEPKIGEKATGTILSIGEDAIFVDLGAKSEGIVERHEVTDDDGALTVAVGEEITGVISGRDDSGSLVLRVRAARGEAARQELRGAYEQRIPVEGLVSAVIKGGVEVTVAGMRAFCPISQLSDRYVENAEDFLGKRMDFRIQRFEDSGRHTNLVVSHRALIEEENARRAEVLREKLVVGAVLDGTVTSIAGYGAFVDLGGLEGLLHVSQMAHHRIEDPHQVVSEGQTLKVQVTKIEPAKKEGQSERISLSIRALQNDPWDDVQERFPIGSEHDGRVTRLETYGAFVELTPGVEGLVHVSQLGSEDHVRHAREVLELGQTTKVRVLDLDLAKRRISLKRQVERKKDAEAEEYSEYVAERGARPADGFGGGVFAGLGKLKDDD